MKTFEELNCWQKARDLSVTLYSHLKDVEDILKEMICKACFSIQNNIAIGHGQQAKYALMYLGDAK